MYWLCGDEKMMMGLVVAEPLWEGVWSWSCYKLHGGGVFLHKDVGGLYAEGLQWKQIKKKLKGDVVLGGEVSKCFPKKKERIFPFDQLRFF